MATQRKQSGAQSGSDGAQKLQVVVPTYNEVENIRPLTERLFKACKEAGLVVDLLFMDDESVGTPKTEEHVASLQKEGYAVRIIVRRKGEGRGLSSAVLKGFDNSKYDTMLCMDADLQHEPEAVPGVAAPVLNGDAEFSIGSRHVDGGGLGFEWSFIRRAISAGATALCRPLTACTDPMSGFFCTTKPVLLRARDRLNPIGFKIALEIMVRCRCKSSKDVAITFREREAGESKLTGKQQIQYLEQLAHLYWDMYPILVVMLFMLAFFVLYVMSKAVMSIMH